MFDQSRLSQLDGSIGFIPFDMNPKKTGDILLFI